MKRLLSDEGESKSLFTLNFIKETKLSRTDEAILRPSLSLRGDRCDTQSACTLQNLDLFCLPTTYGNMKKAP